MFFGGILGNPWSNQYWTIFLSFAATASIVVTAVYVLRGISQIFMGPIVNNNFNFLTDAKLYEKICLTILIIVLFLVGIIPLYFITLIESSIIPIVNKLYL